jgi:TRAP-type C4-dicarboxylate transport system permease small subunit
MRQEAMARKEDAKRRLSWPGRLSYSVGHVATVSILLMMLLISVEVFIRKTFGMSTKIAHDMSGFLLVAVTFLGAAETLRAGKHLRVTILFDNLGTRLRRICEFINLAITMVFIALLLWSTLGLTVDSYLRGNLTDGIIQLPEYLPQALMPVGLAVFLLQLFANLTRLLKGGRNGEGSDG